MGRFSSEQVSDLMAWFDFSLQMIVPMYSFWLLHFLLELTKVLANFDLVNFKESSLNRVGSLKPWYGNLDNIQRALPHFEIIYISKFFSTSMREKFLKSPWRFQDSNSHLSEEEKKHASERRTTK